MIEPPISIVGPAIEASKYFIEEEKCRDMFAKLISSACDSTLSNTVHPSFTEIIKQLSPLDARFISIFKTETTYPAVEWKRVRSNSIITPFPTVVIDFKKSSNLFPIQEQILLTETLDNLTRFGLLKKNQEVLELNYNYDSFKSHWFYNAIEKIDSDDGSLVMTKYRIELTSLGQNFVKCCVCDEQ